ncbi:MAG: phosphatase PAP2 family protein [Methanospirillum sp.]|uniref:phosphatase PAP2 family protein n=1 Tax=Methanospirillum sp. TaxID=45200 RepID=UPI002370332F|nr:phosphatase PAP2 family protein [Methanospirillum sp.]MDD1730353.1 phosphatase PAP2 family protein [Methanospirillum sp.]
MVLDLLMDPGIIASVQNFSPGLTSFFVEGEFLDTMPWYLLVFSIVTFGLHPRYGMRLATLFGINAGLNEAIKLAFHLPRPYWVFAAVEAASAHSSFGFPSGAAQYGAVIYGYIVVIIRRFWVVLLCIILLLITSIVRIFSGIHFFLDTIGGWIIGFLLLAVFLFLVSKVEAYAARLSRPTRLVFCLLVATIPLVLVIPAYISLGEWQLPGPWLELAKLQSGKAIHPDIIQFSVGASGIILGSLLGYEFLLSRGGWNPSTIIKIRAGVLMIGTASVLLVNAILQIGLKEIGVTAMSPQIETFLRMTLVLFWLIGCVPVLAEKAGHSHITSNNKNN